MRRILIATVNCLKTSLNNSYLISMIKSFRFSSIYLNQLNNMTVHIFLF